MYTDKLDKFIKEPFNCKMICNFNLIQALLCIQLT